MGWVDTIKAGAYAIGQAFAFGWWYIIAGLIMMTYDYPLAENKFTFVIGGVLGALGVFYYAIKKFEKVI